jgi:6-pyruvoyl tetrahydropterin synthase/QueD family protein
MSYNQVLVVTKFDAAHRLPDSKDLTTKKCTNSHGHTYMVKVLVEAEKLSNGFVVDFSVVKNAIDILDHASIIYEKDQATIDYNVSTNSKHVILKTPPTAENIARYIAYVVEKALPINADVVSVMLCEGYKGANSNWVTYYAK